MANIPFLNNAYFSAKVGIGTDSPDGLLHVSSGTSGDALVIIESDTDNNDENDNPQLQFKQDGGNTIAKIGLSGDAGTIFTNSLANTAYFGNDEAASVQLYTNATARLTVESGGDVGIGTNNPSAKLHITKDNTTGNALLITNSGSSRSLEINHNADGTGVSDEVVRIMNDGTRLFTIESDGKVGIGTAAPLDLLAVHNSASGAVDAQMNFTTAATGQDSADGFRVGWNGAVAQMYLFEDADMRFATNNAEKMRISSTGAIKFNTYGAGTLVSDASGNITAEGGAWDGPYLPLAGGTMTGSIDFVNNKDISMTDSAGAITRVMVLNTSNTMYIGPVDAYAGGSILYGVAAGVSFQRFFTGASERLRIGSNGNIAIGTTATSYRLQVEQDNDGNLLSRFHNTAANGQGLLIRAGGVSSANRILQLASENDTKVMTVNSNGRVGIGIANPTEKLEVVGNVLITAALLSNQENTDVDSAAAEMVAQVSTTYTAAFFDFVIKKGTNVRSGTVYACHDGTNVEFTETSTNDLGDTSDVTLSVDISGTNMRLLATVTSDDWSVKSLIRAI